MIKTKKLINGIKFMYTFCLRKVGWVVQELQFERYQMSGQTLRVSKTIIDIVKTFYPNLKLKLSNVCWNPSDLEEVSHGGFDLDKVHRSHQEWKLSSGTLQQRFFWSGAWWWHWLLSMFTGLAREECWLWFDYSSTNVNLSKVTQVSTLNKDIYSQVCQAIINKLGNNANTFMVTWIFETWKK